MHSLRLKYAAAQETPVFVSYAEAQEWIQEQARLYYGGLRAFLSRPEYRAALPQIDALYEADKARSDAKVVADFESSGLVPGQFVVFRPVGAFLTQMEIKGMLILHRRVPYVSILPNPFTALKSVRWNAQWRARD